MLNTSERYAQLRRLLTDVRSCLAMKPVEVGKARAYAADAVELFTREGALIQAAMTHSVPVKNFIRERLEYALELVAVDGFHRKLSMDELRTAMELIRDASARIGSPAE